MSAAIETAAPATTTSAGADTTPDLTIVVYGTPGGAP